MSDEPAPGTTGAQDSGDEQHPAAPGPGVRPRDAAYVVGVEIRSAPILSEAECAAVARGLVGVPAGPWLAHMATVDNAEGVRAFLATARTTVPALLRTVAHLREAADTAIRAMEQAAHERDAAQEWGASEYAGLAVTAAQAINHANDERDAAQAEVTALLAQCTALREQFAGAESRAAALSETVNRQNRQLTHAARETVRERRYGP